MHQNKVDFLRLCETEKNLPIFMQPWWLQAVCGADLAWEVAITKDKNEQITAVLLYCTKKKWGFSSITVPYLTKYMGVWMRPMATNKPSKDNKLHEQYILKTLISQIPYSHKLTLQLHYSTSDWSPFYWANFKQTTRYTQIIANLTDKETLYNDLSTDVQRNIKKANARLTIQTTDNFDLFWQTHNTVFDRQKMKNPIPLSIWHNVETTAKERKQRRIYISTDDKNDVQGTLYLIWDNQTAYILASGSTEMGRKVGVMSQLIWQAIADSVGVVDTVDFLGSMLPQIELFNRRFNTEKKAYHVLTKFGNPLLECFFTLFRL
jgi:hypothetical protein